MTHAPLHALRALWAHGGAAGAYVARDQRWCDAIARIVPDVVPDFVRRDGDAVRVLTASIGLDQALGAAVAPQRPSGEADMGTGVGTDAGGARRSGTARGGDEQEVHGAAGDPRPRSHHARMHDWQVQRVVDLQRPVPGDAAVRGDATRVAAAGRAGAPSEVRAHAGGDADAPPAHPNAFAVAAPLRRRASRDDSDQGAEAAAVGRSRGPRLPRAPEDTASAAWRTVGPLVPTLAGEAHRLVNDLLAKYAADVAAPALTGRPRPTSHVADGAGTGERHDLPTRLAQVVQRLERRRAALAERPVEGTAPRGGRPDAFRPSHADVSPNTAVDARASTPAASLGGFRALAARVERLHDAPVTRAAFLQDTAARRGTRAIVTDRAGDVHQVLVAAARAEGLDLEEVTS